MKDQDDSWDDSDKYDGFMGRWSQKLAKLFITWLREDMDIENKRWLEVGCGTGALTHQLDNLTHISSILAIDPSDSYLKAAQSKIGNQSVKFQQAFSEEIPASDSEFDFAVSGLALNFMTDKVRSINEMKRCVKPSGTVACFVWDYKDKMEFLRYFWDAVVELNPEAIAYDEGEIFPICDETNLKNLFTECGLKNITVKKLDIETQFSSFDDYWNPFLQGQGPSGNYVSSLTESEKEELSSKIYEKLPIASDGTINLIARAFGVKGQKV